jgi:carbohydrate-selective porin OprB
MRKVTAKILALPLLALISPSQIFAQTIAKPIDIVQALNIKISGGGTFVFQGTPKDNVGKSEDGSNTAVYVFDLRLEKILENNGKVVVRFKGGNGNGLSKNVKTYANVNAVTDPTFNGELERAKVTDLYYQQLCLDNKLTISFGKLDFTSNFTGNRYSKDKNVQFITSIFSGDKILEAPAHRVALNLSYVLSNIFDLSYGYYSTKTEHIDSDGINALQITYKPLKKGNYKLYIWENNTLHYSCKDLSKKSGTYGFGISADHELSKLIGVFGRLSWKDPSVTKYDTKNNKYIITPTLSWDLGLQIQCCAWSKGCDTIGFAVGQMYDLHNYSNINTTYKNGAETEFEFYYRIDVNKHLGITPAVQYFINPSGGNVDLTNNVFIAGVRTRFDF